MKCLIYCTNARPYLNCDYGTDSPEDYKGYWHIYTANKKNGCSNIVNGSIVAEFDCDEVEEIKYKIGCPFPYLDFESELPKTCLTEEELEDYLFTKKGYQNGYALYIKNLKVFDEPIELKEFNKPIFNCKLRCDNNFEKSFCKDVCSHNLDREHLDVICEYSEYVRDWYNKPNYLTKAPQNMCYCYYKGELCVIISIRPEHTCNILTGKKTIEVRKQIVSALKELIK